MSIANIQIIWNTAKKSPEQSAGSDIPAFIVGLGGLADDDTAVRGGVDEGETAACGVSTDNDAGMAHKLALVAAAEEHKVAGLQVAGVRHMGAHTRLPSAVGGQRVTKTRIQETGKARTVEAPGCLAAIVIGRAQILLGHRHEHQPRVRRGDDKRREVCRNRNIGTAVKFDIPASVVVYHVLRINGER